MRSLVEHSLTIDLCLMIKRGWVKDGQRGTFRLRFSETGECMRLFYELRDPDEAWLELNYRQFFRADVQPEVAQFIPLTFTVPHFGGRRWWMICDGQRVAKIYLPRGGNSFGSRQAWGLVYSSQREDAYGRAFARLGRLERKLESQQRKQAGSSPSKRKPYDSDEGLLQALLAADAQHTALANAMTSRFRACSA